MSGLLCLTWNNHYSSFLKLLSNLHLKDLYCDATIACHGTYYPVHQMVLSTCSEYFEEIFCQTKCKHPYIIVKDVKAAELEALLNYMYKGEVNVSQELLPELIKAAESLKIKGLAVPDDRPDKPTTNTDKKRSNTASSSSQAKKKRLFEGKRKENICLDDEDSQYQTELDNNSEKRASRIKDSNEGNRRTPRSASHCEERIELQDIKVEDSELTSDTNSTQQLQEVKVEAEEVPNYSEQLLFSPQEPELGLEPSVSSSFISVGTFSSDGIKDLSDDNQYDSQAIWTGNTDDPGEEELQAPLEVGESGFQIYPSVVDAQFPSNANRSAAQLDTTSISTQVLTKSPSCPPTKLFRCSFCSFENATSSVMKRHYVFKHSNQVKPFACHMCSYRCFRSHDLVKHNRTHTGEKPFKCSKCAYRASRKHHLEGHLKTHTGEKSFKCSKCPYIASRRDHLDNHFRAHLE